MNSDTVLSEYMGLDRAIAELMVSYHELNSSVIEELFEEPTPLEFMRYVALNRPFVIRKGADEWEARRKWDADYLIERMGEDKVKVAWTRDGDADAVVWDDATSQMIFRKPAYQNESFTSCLRRIQHPDLQGPGSNVCYLQGQNDCLRDEYEPLAHDVPPSIPFARIALQCKPDAINFWLGNSRSVTSLHKDNYENIYVQILGRKHFVLLPPVDVAAVAETTVPAASYRWEAIKAGTDAILTYGLDSPAELVPFPTWDPDLPNKRATKFSKLAQPMRVTLGEGDMLYLPAQWFHKVSQTCDIDNLCCAVNYWYDMEYSGTFLPAMSFVRSAAELATKR
ncbi:MAG: hypothetical protein M1820_001996 [Bogoriella megaspora]|nr:MAG: hypothetical protein M1820_001996 [Bogoriella megaspora]